MADDEAEYEQAEEALRLEQEVDAWKAKFKQLELKKRESELTLNKIKTEVNSLRSVDKNWKDGAKATFLNILDMQRVFGVQVDQILSCLAVVAKTSDRIQLNTVFFKKVKQVIAQLQAKVAMQEDTINHLNSRIKVLTVELDDKTRKVERLSEGIEEEVERLVKPIRERLADTMVGLMKEKAARAQERRDLADLWPEGHILPSVLMRSRALSPEERERRLAFAAQQSANLALSLEVRANVAESRMWTMKYDDYGRPFYEHSKTGQTLWDPPEIMQYKPPAGRDEMGNWEASDESDSNNWTVISDSKGRIHYRHKVSQEVSVVPPYAYKSLPRGRSKEQQVSEAAETVIKFIKEKIAKHILIKKKRKEELENPLTPEQRKKKEKELRNMTAEELAAREPEVTADGELWDLTQFQYDIETVEMLANQFSETQAGDKDPEVFREEQRAALAGSEVRNFPEDMFEDVTLAELDLAQVTANQLRGLVENLAQKEEKLEAKLHKTRDNLKDFSVLLVEKIREQEVAQMRKLNEERLAREKERREKRKQLIAERQRQRELAKEKRQQDKEAAEKAAKEAATSEDVENVVEHIAASTDGAAEHKTAIENADVSEHQNPDPGPGEEAKGDAGDAASKPALLPADDDEDLEAEETWSDDEDLMDASKDVDGGTRMDIRSDDDLDTIVSTALGNSIFSELPHEEGEADHTPMMPHVTNDLVNFALFCGFNGLHMEDAPNAYNANYSMRSDQVGSMKEDDEWLTCHFFLGCTKEQLDACSETLVKDYQATDNGVLPIDVSAAQTLVFETPTGQTVKRSQARGYTASARGIDDGSAARSFQEWKSQQLMADVVQRQLDHEEVMGLLNDRNENYPPVMQDRLSDMAKSHNYEVSLEFEKLRIHFKKPVSRYSGDSYFVQLFFGLVALTTEPTKLVLSSVVDFPLTTPSDLFTINDLQINDLLVELINQREDNPEKVYMCKGSHSMEELVGGNFNRLMAFSVPLMDNDKQVVATLELQVRARLVNAEFKSVNHLDPLHLLQTERLTVDRPDIKPTIVGQTHQGSSALVHQISGLSQPKAPMSRQNSRTPLLLSKKNLMAQSSRSLDARTNITGSSKVPSHQKLSSEGTRSIGGAEDWEQAVSELRGDGAVTVTFPEADLHELEDGAGKPQHHYPRPIKTLPNFLNARLFLEKKLAAHLLVVHSLTRSNEERRVQLDELIRQKSEHFHRAINDAKNQRKKLLQSAVDHQEQLMVLLRLVGDLRKPSPEPKEPQFEDFGPVLYVPSLNNLPAQLDAKGKKKKAIPNDQLKTLLDSIEHGEFDGKDNLPISDAFYPNQGQLLKLNKAREARNVVLDSQRVQEMNVRDKLMEMYRAEHEKFLEAEEARMRSLGKALKECRKQHLKYDSVTYRATHFEEELRGYEIDTHSMQDLLLLHQRASSATKTIALKYHLEFHRQQEHLVVLKKKLNKLLNARRYLLELPKSVKNPLDHSIALTRCFKHLKLIKLEIFSIKNQLKQEGIKLRCLLEEEKNFYMNESIRLNVSIEIIRQRSCFDQVIAMYKTQLINHLGNVTKYKLLEADADDVGTATLDDKGECYREDRVWDSPDVSKALKKLQTYAVKVETMNGYIQSTANSQRLLVSSLYAQFNQVTFALRDSYLEHSDYERAQTVLFSILNLYKKHKCEYERKKLQVSNETQQYVSEKNLLERQMQDNVMIHEVETKYINSNTNVILTSLRNYIDDYRRESDEKIHALESNVIALSKECQKIREELLAQKMIFNDKIKILWAFIHTLQTSLQQLSAKLEITTEENEKIVISSRLMADNIKAALRKERQHNANIYFIIHTQRGTIKHLYNVIQKLIINNQKQSNVYKNEKAALRKEVYDYVYTYTELTTNVDYLFEFFVSRVANLCGANADYNNKLAEYYAPQLLAILCRNGGTTIKYHASRALSAIGWNSFVEQRILIWDSLSYWKNLKRKVVELHRERATARARAAEAAAMAKLNADAGATPVLSGAKQAHQLESMKKELLAAQEVDEDADHLNDANLYDAGLDLYNSTNNINSIITLYSNMRTSIFSNKLAQNNSQVSLRTFIKQRRQWALRVTKRKEGPNLQNQKLLNIKDNVLPILFELSISENKALSFTVEKLQEIVQTRLRDRDNKHVDIVVENIRMIQVLVQEMGSASSSRFLAVKQSAEHGGGGGGGSPLPLRVVSADDVNYSISVSRCAALAISIASYELSNHEDILSNYLCLFAILTMSQTNDVEIQTHAAITIANLTYKNEYAQYLFGALGVVETLATLLAVPIADVLEAATSALSNLTSYHDENCHKFIVQGGVEAAVQVLFNSSNNENLLDLDQADEIQANTAELLTNISRYNTMITLPFITTRVINNLVLLCAANNIQCKRYIPLILGNVSQQNDIREMIGLAGGVEALFLSLENDDHIVKCNVLWALANLMYYPPNQERAGRFMQEVCNYIFRQNAAVFTENTRIHAAILLGNMLYYNTPNRVRFLETDHALETVLLYVKSRDCIPILEGCLRVVLSLTYLDSIALYLGKEAAFIPVLLSYLVPPYFNNSIIKFVLEVLCNLCLHHDNRKAIYDAGGIDLMVPLHAHTDEQIRAISVSIISHLEDITPEEVLARMREQLPIERVVKMATHSDPLVRAVAAEQIGDHVYRNSQVTNPGASMTQAQAQEAISSIGGIDSLLAIANNPGEPVISLLPALWSLRNLLVNNFANQSQFYHRDGIFVLCQVLDGLLRHNSYAEQADKVIEGVLLCLSAAINKHDRNARRLVMIGLDSVLGLANSSSAAVFAQHKARRAPGASKSGAAVKHVDPFVNAAIAAESVQALVHSLLLMLGPFNYVVCSNCHKKQDLHGTNCLFCAHRLLVDASDLNMQHGQVSSPSRKPGSAPSGGDTEESPVKSFAMSQSARFAPTSENAVESRSRAVILSRSAGQLPTIGARGGAGASKFSMARSLPSKTMESAEDEL